MVFNGNSLVMLGLCWACLLSAGELAELAVTTSTTAESGPPTTSTPNAGNGAASTGAPVTDSKGGPAGAAAANVNDTTEVLCTPTMLDQMTGDLVVFGTGPLAPISAEELSVECIRLKDSMQALERYANNCSQGLGQIMLKMFVDAAGTELRYRCNGPGKEEYLKLMPCLVEKAGLSLYKCNVRQSGYFQAVLDMEKQDRVPLACCYQTKFERCVSKASRKCGEEHANFSAKVVDNMSADLKDTACRKFVRDPSLCNALPKIQPVKEPKYVSMLPALAEILDSI